jgi:NAD-dependent DNA ligase
LHSDRQELVIYETNPNMLIPYYLMYSYLYYEKDESIISDDEYDRICKTLYELYPVLEHPHKHMVDRDALMSGTGFHIQYNERIRSAAMALLAKK